MSLQQKRIYLENGRIRFATTTRADERLGAVAVRERLATWWQVQAAAKGISAERRLGSVLVDQGILSGNEQVNLVREQVRGIVIDALQWAEGSYRFEPSDRTIEEPITVDWSVADAFLEEARRDQDEEALWRRIGGPGATILLDRSHEFPPPKSLDATERRIMAAARAGRTVSQIIHSANAPPGTTVRTLVGLERLGALEIRKGKPRPAGQKLSPPHLTPRPRHDQPPRTEHKGGAGRYSMAGEGAKSTEVTDHQRPWLLPPALRAERARILDLAERLHRMDHYQALGLEHGAAPELIESAYLDRVAKFHGDRWKEPGLSDLRGHLERIHEAVRAAHATLRHPEGRALYDAGRERERQAVTAAESGPEAGAGEILRQSSELLRKGRLEEAIPSLREVLRLRPDMALAHFRLGQTLAATTGDFAEARLHLERACDLQPANPRFQDALRSLAVPDSPPPRRIRERLSLLLNLPPSDD
jgi:tetratricopeptide (TPR) repeat protein